MEPLEPLWIRHCPSFASFKCTPQSSPSIQISLAEMNWYYERSSGASNPGLLEFLTFLSDVTEISFTADYTVVSRLCHNGYGENAVC
jgi:hypothetical protein